MPQSFIWTHKKENQLLNVFNGFNKVHFINHHNTALRFMYQLAIQVSCRF